MSRIAIVEDDPNIARFLIRLVEKLMGVEVWWTEDGDALLEQCRAGSVDLVVMDVSLGNTRLDGRPVHGTELTRAIKSDSRSAHVPVILATAHAMRGDSARLLAESGANDYVPKPVTDIEAFRALLQRHLPRAA